MTTENDLAWLAGYIDGEGCFSIFPYQSHGNTCIGYKFSTANTNVENIRRVKDILSSMFNREVRYTPYVNKTRDKVAYWIHVSRATELEALIRAVLPHLAGKRPQANLMLEYLALTPNGIVAGGNQSAGTKGFQSKYDDRHWDVMHRMKDLNKKGRSLPARDQTASSHEDEVMARTPA